MAPSPRRSSSAPLFAFALSAAAVAPACAQQDTSPAGSAASAAPVVTRIRFFPAPGQAAKMKGARFTGSITGPTNDFEELVKITDEPREGAWNEIEVKGKDAFRFVKFEGTPNTGAEVAEVEFWAGGRKLSGTPFSTVAEDGKEARRAFDGDTATTYRGREVNFQYVGIDLGEAAQAAAPTVSVPSGAQPGPVKVRLKSATPGAVVRYTLDGQVPGPDSGTVAADGAEVEIKESTVLVAAAFRPDLVRSVATVAAYRIGAGARAAKSVTTFHIGNSLTDTMVPWMEPMGAAMGRDWKFLRFTIPGAPTDWLWDHPGGGFGDSRYEQAFLIRAPIDHVFTQPFAGHGRSVENEAEHSQRFYDACRKHSPDVQAWLYVQWPSKDLDDSWSRGEGATKGLPGVQPADTFEAAIPNFLAYAEAVRARIQQTYKGKPVRIVPAGLALANLKKAIEGGKVPGMADFFAECFSDDLHMSKKGAYLVSLVHIACVTGESPVGKVPPLQSGLTDEQAKVFQQIAWDAAKGYRFSGVGSGTPAAKKAAAK